MKVVRKAERQVYEQSVKQHEELLDLHARQVEQVQQMNAAIEEQNAENLKVAEKRQRARSKLRAALRGKSQPEIVEIPPLEAPPTPEPLHDPPDTFTVERVADDYEDKEGQRFKMIGPLRVLPGQLVLTNDRTGQIQIATDDEYDRMYARA